MRSREKKNKRGRALLVAKPWKGGLGQYFYRALQDFFTDVKWFCTYPAGMADSLSYRADKHQWRLRLSEKIAAADYDLAIFINTIDAFSTMQHSDKNIVWLTDDPRPVSRYLKPFGKVYLADPGYQDDVIPFLKKGQFGGILPFAHLPEVHHPFNGNPSKRGVCFIGNRDPKRKTYIKALLSSGIEIAVYGNFFLKDRLFWKYPGRFHPPIANSRMGEIYSRFSLSLNIHAQVVRGGTNMRTFECAGYGIPQAVEQRPGISEYFEPGREIVVFNSPEEMVEILKVTGRDGHVLARMAKRAQERAIAEHTYHHRIQKLLEGL